ncbi:MAG: hypothetical protein NXI27_29935 [Alphaproteobacteria bacterium]|nr:hypothetical protein [Alphaproteobacteria bacterium]
MARNFAEMSRLENEAGVKLVCSSDTSVRDAQKWEMSSQLARRAFKGSLGTAMVLALAACKDDSGSIASLSSKVTELSGQNADLQSRLNPKIEMVSGEVAQPETFPDTFSMDVSQGGTFEIAGFDVVEDTVEIIGVSGADGSTLAELEGDEGLGGELISIQPNEFDGSLVVNFGFDSLGDVVSLTIQEAASEDLGSIEVSLVESDGVGTGGDAGSDGGDTGGDAGSDGGDAGADGGDTGGDGGDASAGELVEVTGDAPVQGTDAAEEFTITVNSAEGGQLVINNFDVANDSVNLSGLTDVVADTLDDLVGQEGFGGELISVQDNPFSGSQFVNLGVDSSGEIISFELGGVTQDDLSAVAVSIA